MGRLFATRLLYVAWLIAGVGALTAGWYALAPSSGTGTPPPYVEGVAGEAQHINPLFAGLNEVDADLAALIFNGLVRIDADGTPRPDLTERWDISADGLTYTFHLRDRVFWHDGRTLSAADVAFTIAQVQAPGFAGPATLAAAWDGVVVTTPDPLTVVMGLPVPSVAFLAQTSLGILPEHLLAGLGARQLLDAPFNREPVGTGPFRLAALSRRGATLERNTSYYAGTPALREVQLRFFRDGASVAAALRAGDLDAALLGEDQAATAREALEARPDLVSTNLVLGGYTVLYLNNQRAPLNDPRLRRAIAASIDTTALLAAAPGGLAGDGPITPQSWAYTPGDWPPAAEAGALFDAAAWPREERGVRARAGRPLELEIATNASPAREALAAAVAEQLRAQGVAVTVVTMPSSELLRRRIEPRDYDLLIFGWETGVDPDPYGAWHTSQIAAPGRNIAGYHDALADALLEGARETLDIGERRELYERFTQRFVETAPSVVLQYPARPYVHPRGLRGLVEGLLFTPADRFREVHLWRIEE